MSDRTHAGSHPEPEDLAAYLEMGLSAPARARIEEHLAACDDCRVIVSESFRTLHSRRRRSLRSAWLRPALAAAALLVLAVGGTAVLSRGRPGSTPLRSVPGDLDFEQVGAIEVVHPPDGRTVSADSLLFVWRQEPGEPFYRLTLTDEAGDVLWRTSTSDTVVVPGADIDVEPGVRYFWIVDALLAGGRTATSGAVSFQIRDGRQATGGAADKSGGR